MEGAAVKFGRAARCEGLVKEPSEGQLGEKGKGM